MGAELVKYVYAHELIGKWCQRSGIQANGGFEKVYYEWRPVRWLCAISRYERKPTPVNLGRSMNNIQKLIATACALVITALPCWGQQQGGHREQTPASGTADAEFLQAADEVLAVMSKILSLPVKEPLKKSVRSREEIREFLLRQMREDKDDTKRYADQKALEALGLIPKGYPLDQKLLAYNPETSYARKVIRLMASIEASNISVPPASANVEGSGAPVGSPVGSPMPAGGSVQ